MPSYYTDGSHKNDKLTFTGFETSHLCGSMDVPELVMITKATATVMLNLTTIKVQVADRTGLDCWKRLRGVCIFTMPIVNG
jgi:hypothetical protein